VAIALDGAEATMTSIDPGIIAGLRRDGLLREGHFVFRSGRHSAGLLDRDLLLADPTFASHMGYVLAKHFFTAHVETVAAPSIWGAGLAQWVGYFLEPRPKIVYATPNGNGGFAIADHLTGAIAGRRVVLIDNLVMTGETMTRFARQVDALGGTVIGIGTLWNASEHQVEGHPVVGVLNPVYETFHPDECPLCAGGASEPEAVPY
jgi:orotate phosphoribosyltransferase